MSLRIVGNKFFEGATEVRLNAVNDTTAFANAIAGDNYKNQNFPNRDIPGMSILPANSYREFWWKYFWLCNHLGINAVRLNSGRWEMDLMHSCWYNDRAKFDSLMTDMLDMAYACGVYVVFCFGGPNQDGSGDPGTFDRNTHGFDKKVNLSNPMTGSILEPGTEACNHWIAWMGEVMIAYAYHPALGMWDLSNEPDHNTQFRTFWKIKYPSTWAQAYVDWANAVTAGVKSINHTHPVMIGSAGGDMFDWGESWYDMRNIGSDCTGVHFYASVEGPTNEYLVATRKQWSDNLDRPCFFSEVGWSQPAYPWELSYWPWADQMGVKYGVSMAWMELDNAPTGGIPAYPGYPILQSVLDSIPDMPDGVTPPPVTGGGYWLPILVLGGAAVILIFVVATAKPTS